MKTSRKREVDRPPSGGRKPVIDCIRFCRAAMYCLAAVGLATLLALQIQAATDVSGFIVGETWTSAGSPYRMVDDVYVLALTIESNVTVQADGNYEFEVGGQLQVNGIPGAEITFTPGTTNGWKGILFRDAVPGSFFTHAIVEGANMGGVRITNTPPAFTNCTIRNNISPHHGGGIMAEVSGSPLILQGCLVTSNTAGLLNGSRYGGGIFVSGDALIAECELLLNTTDGTGNDYGGGIFASSGNCTITKSFIAYNYAHGNASHNGDGIYLGQGNHLIANCLILTNGVHGVSGHGGALYLASGGNVKMLNTLAAGNAHYGIEIGSGTLSAVNCTIVGSEWQAVYRQAGTAALTNCILFFNYASGAQIAGSMTLDHCNVQGGVQPGPSNISFAPALCPQNFSLVLGSPCIDAGNPGQQFNDLCIENTFCTPFSRGTVRNDIGAYGGPGACGGVGVPPPGEPPHIITQPQSQSTCLGQNVVFNLGATGSQPLSFQWYFNGTIMDGETDATLVLTNLQAGDAGIYTVTVANNYGSETSLPANLQLHDACVDIHMYTGLNIAGQAGVTYVLKCTTDLNNTNFATWTPLATNTMGSPGWFYLDMESPFAPKRFYGVKRVE